MGRVVDKGCLRGWTADRYCAKSFQIAFLAVTLFPPFQLESGASFLASCGLFFQRHFCGEFDGRDVAQG